MTVALVWLVPTPGMADPEAPVENTIGETRLLQHPVLTGPDQEYRLKNEDWIVLPRNFGTASPLLAGPAESINEEVAFGTSMRGEFLSQLQQSVAALSGGGYAVVWVEGDFPERDVRTQWLGPNGRELFEAGGRIVAGMVGIDEARAVVVPHSEAGAFVAFARRDASNNFASIHAQSFDASGLPRWPGDGVVVATGGGQSDPHLVPDPVGGVYVCWTEGSGAIDTVAPWCQHLSSSGSQMWGPDGLLAGGEPGLRVLPRGVSDGSGGLLIFWRNQRDDSDIKVDSMLMEGQHFGADGTKLWGETGLLIRSTNLAESNNHSFRFYNVVSDGSGGAVLAFNDWVDLSASNLDVVAQRVAGDGSLLWGDGAPVVASAEHHQHETTITAPGGGAFVVAQEAISSSHSKLWLYRLGSDGTHQWPVAGVQLSDPDATALDYGPFGSFDQGLLRLVWTHQLIPSTFEMDVQLARYTLSGERLDGPAGFAVTTAQDAQFLHGFAFSAEDRKMLSVWDDRRKADWADLDVYGSLTLTDGIFLDGFESADVSSWSSATP